MPNLKKSGRMVLSATLAASTMLASLPPAFAAGNGTVRVAQAEPEAAPPPAQERPGEAREPEGGRAAQERPRARAPEPEAERPAAEEPQRPRRAQAAEEPQREAPAERRAAPEGEADEQTAPNRRRPAEADERPAPAAEAPAPEAAPPPRAERRRPAEAEPQGEAPRPEGEAGGNRRQRQGNEPAAGAGERPAEAEAPARPRNAAPPAAPADAPAAPEGVRPPAPATEPAQRPAEEAPPPPATRTAPPVQAEPQVPAPRETAPAAAPRSEAPTEAPRPAPETAAPPPPAQNGTAVAPTATPAPQPPAAPGSAAPPPAAPAPAGIAPQPPSTPAAPPPAATGQGAATLQPPPPQDLRPQAVPADIQNAPVQPGRINQSDARVQTLQQPVDVRPITQETGERIREEPRYDLPPEAKVVKRDGDRQILSLGAAAVAGAVAGAAAGYFIRSNDDDRIAVDSSESYSERLPGGRTRDTVVRANGVQVVTVTNRYGDVIRRSRIMPDGREVVLFYDPYGEDSQRPDYYDDPGRDLPPVRLDIPEDRYVVDIDQPDERLYYDTLVAPPVETVERIYSVDEVRRSERIRDKVRRIDLATINFDFASAAISQSQAQKLQDLADAIKRIVDTDPGETFLIEGHTDAVGGPEANLVLSDKRAESVASALTQYFDVPAENLVTQGYGEQELKVNTQAENRENRRVTVRRITALVKPVATSSR